MAGQYAGWQHDAKRRPPGRPALSLNAATSLVVLALGLVVLLPALFACDPTGPAAKPGAPTALAPTGTAGISVAASEAQLMATITPAPSATATAPARPLALTSIHMVDPNVGWGLSQTAVLRTADGGSRWSDVTPRAEPQPEMRNVAPSATVLVTTLFLDADSAWLTAAAGDANGGFLLRTRDGGRSWTKSQLPGPVGRLTFLDHQRGWLLADRGAAAGSQAVDIYRTEDGGERWQLLASAKPDAEQAGSLPFSGTKQGLAFLDATTGWASGVWPVDGRPWFFVTRDGGHTWQEQRLPLPTTYQKSQIAVDVPRFFGPNDGVLPARFSDANTRAGAVFLTRDGGTTWSVTVPLDKAFRFSFPTSTAGWALSGEPGKPGVQLYRTLDTGRTWAPTASAGTLDNVEDLQFVTNRVGYAFGREPDGPAFLLKTTDGGQTWLPLRIQLAPGPGDSSVANSTQLASSPLPLCRADDLSGTAVWQGATGSLAGSVLVTNRSQRVCLVQGVPRLQFLDPEGNRMSADPLPSGQASRAEAKPAALRPGETAAAHFVWRNWCGARPSEPPRQIRVTLANGMGILLADNQEAAGPPPRCDAPGEASTMSVEPFQPARQ